MSSRRLGRNNDDSSDSEKDGDESLPAFNVMVVNISRSIDEDTFREMKILCRRDVAVRKLDKMENPDELIFELHDIGKISDTNVRYLENIFKTIEKRQLVKIVRHYQERHRDMKDQATFADEIKEIQRIGQPDTSLAPPNPMVGWSCLWCNHSNTPMRTMCVSCDRPRPKTYRRPQADKYLGLLEQRLDEIQDDLLERGNGAARNIKSREGHSLQEQTVIEDKDIGLHRGSVQSFARNIDDGSRPTSGSASRGRCSYRELCGKFKKSLELPGEFFEPKFDKCYCTSCFYDRGDKLYYPRGQPAKDYGVPFGWCRFALKTPPKASALDVFNKWHVAFHGTRLESVKPIVETGEFLMPGDIRMGGAKLSECYGHFSDERKPQGFDTKQIFLSPSIRYSGCDVYAPASDFTDKSTKKSYQARVVFQVCINPTSYKVGPQTIGVESEIDPKFSNQEIEWFTKERGSVIPYGLLVKIE